MLTWRSQVIFSSKLNHSLIIRYYTIIDVIVKDIRPKRSLSQNRVQETKKQNSTKTPPRATLSTQKKTKPGLLIKPKVSLAPPAMSTRKTRSTTSSKANEVEKSSDSFMNESDHCTIPLSNSDTSNINLTSSSNTANSMNDSNKELLAVLKNLTSKVKI